MNEWKDWEYKTVMLKPNSCSMDDYDHFLNEMGKSGWELTLSVDSWCTFKRPIQWHRRKPIEPDKQ